MSVAQFNYWSQHYDRASPIPVGIAPEERLEAADVQLWSELYRASLIVRAAVRLALFDRLRLEPRSPAALAGELGAEPGAIDRLCQALASMGLLEWCASGWANTPLAHRTLRTDSPTYQGHMILHNSSPAYLASWAALGERLGLPPDLSGGDPQAAHDLFLEAMADTASAGQAKILVDALDLRGSRSLLDVGGGGGHYAIALCQAYPELEVTVLDLPQSQRLAEVVARSAGMEKRVRFVGSDYRSGPLPGPADAVLFY